MKEIVIELIGLGAAIVIGAFIASCFTFNSNEGIKYINKFILVLIAPAIISILVLYIFKMEKKTPKYEVVRSLKVVDKVYPGYVYGLNQYTINFDGRDMPVDARLL